MTTGSTAPAFPGGKPRNNAFRLLGLNELPPTLSLQREIEDSAFGTVLSNSLSPTERTRLLEVPATVFSTLDRQWLWGTIQDLAPNNLVLDKGVLFDLMRVNNREWPWPQAEMLPVEAANLVLELCTKLEGGGVGHSLAQQGEALMELGQKMKDHSYLGLPVDDLRAEVATLLASIRLRSTAATDSCIGPLSEMNLVPPSFLIDDFLLEATLIGLVAPPKAGKTFWAVMMAVCIATGRPFFGYKVNGPAKVVWVAGEDLEHLPNRIHAVMEQYDFSQEERALYDENFLYFRRETRFNLSDPMLVETFLQDISALGDACSLVVFDTYAKTSGIDDENSASSTGEVFRQLERIRSAANAAVLILHHTTKGGRTSRGSSAFDASVRMLLNVDASGLVVGENNHGQTGLRIKATIGNSSFLDSNRRPVGVLKVEDRPLHDIFSLLVRLDAENPGAVNREQVASAAKEERLGARSSVYNKIKELIDKGCITEVDGGFLKPGVFE